MGYISNLTLGWLVGMYCNEQAVGFVNKAELFLPYWVSVHRLYCLKSSMLT